VYIWYYNYAVTSTKNFVNLCGGTAWLPPPTLHSLLVRQVPGMSAADVEVVLRQAYLHTLIPSKLPESTLHSQPPPRLVALKHQGSKCVQTSVETSIKTHRVEKTLWRNNSIQDTWQNSSSQDSLVEAPVETPSAVACYDDFPTSLVC
jgi:hypothetical protein